nr:MAG TPA: 30S ribosomal protein S27 [Caudoviricetes sp.]
MNKYQDALNLLKSWAKKDRNAYSPKHLKKYKRLCKYITGGSRKAIPKKTSCSKPFNIPHLNIDITFGKCPTCGLSLVGQQAYCTKCGQAIDWNENNEVMESVNNV